MFIQAINAPGSSGFLTFSAFSSTDLDDFLGKKTKKIQLHTDQIVDQVKSGFQITEIE